MNLNPLQMNGLSVLISAISWAKFLKITTTPSLCVEPSDDEEFSDD
jgi:hypothetical protein